MRHCIMIDEKLSIAIQKSDEVIEKINLDTLSDEKMISTKRIIYIVQHCTNTRIGIAYVSFSEALKEADDDDILSCGAMMRVYKKNNEQVADIIVNKDMSSEYQRFSLVHELGHLMTNQYTIEEPGYTLSAHINPDVFSISKSEYDDSEILLSEQIANVFALRVLIPYKLLEARLEKYDNLSELSSSFGVAKNAIFSRIALGR